MITVKIYEEDLVKLLIDRVKYWTNDVDVIDLYTEYYESIIECFDGSNFDPAITVDNDYINNTAVITEEEFGDYGIEDEDDDRILLYHQPFGKETLYLIRTY